MSLADRHRRVVSRNALLGDAHDAARRSGVASAHEHRMGIASGSPRRPRTERKPSASTGRPSRRSSGNGATPHGGSRKPTWCLSSGGSVNEAVEALRSDEEVTEAGRARVRRLQRIARRHGLALRRLRPPAISAAGRLLRLDDRGPADEQHRGTHRKHWSAGHEPGRGRGMADPGRDVMVGHTNPPPRWMKSSAAANTDGRADRPLAA